MRNFTPDDQDAVRALVLDGMRERWGEAYDDSFNPDLDDIWATHVAHGAEVVVADDGGRIVAVGMLLPEPEDRGRIRRVSVDRSHRRQGLGRAVVDELVARARDRAMVEVLVRADTPWTSALALYRSCGFTCVGADDTDTLFSLTV
ncbi:GNAT family N-acetyltransferase [Aquihabitans sp. McL0605]|uniref:GNAT family N-acetyltransferase n=1 Tax=Aquihabitans sp. McL0605 TaxID=3415671 RepID=UPI003CEEED04